MKRNQGFVSIDKGHSYKIPESLRKFERCKVGFFPWSRCHGARVMPWNLDSGAGRRLR